MLQPYIGAGAWPSGTAARPTPCSRTSTSSSARGDTVLVLAGDHIYKMDYQPFIAAHRRKRADVTIAVRRVPLAEASRMGVLALDDQDRVTEWQEKPKQPKSDLASMGVYVFSKRALLRWLDGGPARLRRATSSRRCSRRRPGVRLPVRRLLAGRRDDPVVLGGQHGAPRGQRPSWTCTTASGSSTRGPRSGRRPRSARPPRSIGASSRTAA